MIRPEKILGVGADVLLFVLISLLVVGAGVVAGLGDVQAATVVTGALCGLLLLMRPALALYFALISSLVLVGLAQLYFPELQFIRWSVAVFATALAVLALIANLNLSHYPREDRSISPLLWWITAFALLGLISSAINRPTAAEFAFGFKGYFQAWGLFYAIALMRWKPEVVDNLPKVLDLGGVVSAAVRAAPVFRPGARREWVCAAGSLRKTSSRGRSARASRAAVPMPSCPYC